MTLPLMVKAADKDDWLLVDELIALMLDCVAEEEVTINDESPLLTLDAGGDELPPPPPQATKIPASRTHVTVEIAAQKRNMPNPSLTRKPRRAIYTLHASIAKILTNNRNRPAKGNYCASHTYHREPNLV